MHNREKVIKALECYCESDSFDKPNCKDCPAECMSGYMSIPFIQQVLAMLKEQEAIKRTSRKGTNGFSIVWTCGACGSDLHPNNAKAKYCSNCGQAVKWD